MPRYLFHLQSSSDVDGDVEGRELPDDACAAEEANATAVEILADEVKSGRTNSQITVTVERSDMTKVAIVKVRADVETFFAT